MSGVNSTDINNFIAVAETLADISADISRKYFRSKFDMAVKESSSPLVTQADFEIETAIRKYLAQELPNHGILGEEYGQNNVESEYLWVIDPLDGTSAFSCGKSTFVTLIALLKSGKPILGIINQPILKERWRGVEGWSTVFNGQVCSTGEVSQAGIVRLGCTSPLMFNAQELEKFNKVKGISTITSFGGDGYLYGLLAGGFIDIVMESDLQLYDIAAVVPVIKGAGGCVTDWNGNDITLETFKGNVIATRSTNMHNTVMGVIAK